MLPQPVVIVEIRDDILAPIFMTGLAVRGNAPLGMASHAFRHPGEADLPVFFCPLLILVAIQAGYSRPQVRLVGESKLGVGRARQTADGMVVARMAHGATGIGGRMIADLVTQGTNFLGCAPGLIPVLQLMTGGARDLPMLLMIEN